MNLEAIQRNPPSLFPSRYYWGKAWSIKLCYVIHETVVLHAWHYLVVIIFIGQWVVGQFGVVHRMLVVRVRMCGEIGATDRNTDHVILQPIFAEIRAAEIKKPKCQDQSLSRIQKKIKGLANRSFWTDTGRPSFVQISMKGLKRYYSFLLNQIFTVRYWKVLTWSDILKKRFLKAYSVRYLRWGYWNF